MQKKKIQCPSCNSVNLERKSTVPIAKLKELWSNFFSINLEIKQAQASLELLQCQKCHLGFFSPTIIGQPHFYEQLSKLNFYYEHEGKTEYEYASKRIEPLSKVLDIGCGSGELMLHLENVDYTGIEFNPDAIAKATTKGLNVTNRSLEDIYRETKGKYYDYICIFQVLEHVEKPNDLLEQVIKLLKPNGTLLIAVPNNDSFICNAPNNLLNLPPHHNLRWNEHSLKILLKKFNFKEIKVFKEGLTLVHFRWFLTVKLSNKLNHLFKRKLELISTSKTDLVLLRLLSWTTYFLKPAYYFFKEKIGHTIIIECSLDRHVPEKKPDVIEDS